MDFDPTTAKPVSEFDPSTAKPVSDSAVKKELKPLTREPTNALDRFFIEKMSQQPGLGLVPDIQGSKGGRFIQGMADLPVGAMQLGMNLVGAGGAINPQLKDINARTEQLRGPGFDWMRLAGNMANPATIGVLSKVPMAVDRMAKIGQGVGIGAIAGALSPVNTGDNFASEKAQQIAGGAAIGGAIPAVAPLVTIPAKAAYHGLIEPWANPAAIKGRAYVEAAGDKVLDIIKNLRENKQIVPGSAPTAGEAAVPAGSAEFSAFAKAASEARPSAYVARGDEQNAARLAQIRTVGQTPEALDAAKGNRSANSRENYGAVAQDRINPKSDVAIMEDAIAGREASKGEALRDWGRFATTAAQQEVLSNRQFPVEGMPRVPARYTNQADRVPEAQSAASDAAGIAAYRQKQADYLKNAMESLQNTVGLDTKGMETFAGRPSMKSAVQDALLSAQETGNYFPAAKGEQFSVANLQRIKESLDAGVAAAKKSVEAGKRPELSPAELESTRRQFIQWLSNKSPGWQNARLQHAADSVPINQMQVGQYLEGKLIPALSEDAKQKATVYSGALRDAPGTIKRATGSPRFEELAQVLDENQLAAVNSVRDDLARGARFTDLARAGAKAAPDATGPVGNHKLTGMFSREVTIANAIIGRLEGKINKKLAAEISVEMLNPPKVADSLEKASANAAANKLRAENLAKWLRTGTAEGIGAGERK